MICYWNSCTMVWMTAMSCGGRLPKITDNARCQMPGARWQVPGAKCQVGRLAPDTHSFLSFPAFTKPNTTIVRVIIINGDVLIEKYCTEDEANGTNRKHNSRECPDDINVFQPGNISQLWYFNDWRWRQNWSTEADSALSGIIPNAPFLILPTLNSSSSLSWSSDHE